MSLSKPINTFTYDEIKELEKQIQNTLFDMGKGKYNTGKIYRIVQIDKFVLIYVGSTIEILDCRFSGHRSFIKFCPYSKLSQYIFSNGGPDNFRIELIMNYPCRSKHELLQKEGYFIRLMRPLCNTVIPGFQPLRHVSKPPTKRDIQKELQIAPRMYSEIADISEDEAKSISTSMSSNKATYMQILQLQKYWFDTHRVQQFDGTELERELVFKAIGKKGVRSVFENLFAFNSNASADELRYLNPFEDLHRSASGRVDAVSAIKNLCELLEINSPHVDSAHIPQDRVVEHETELQEIVQRLISIMPTVKTKSQSTDPLKVWQMKVSNIFSEWAGTSFRQHRFGNQKNGKQAKIDYLVVADDEELSQMRILMNAA